LLLDRGIKVVRSPSKILTLIKSCDKSTEENAPVIIKSVCNPVEDCVTTLPQPTENVHKKVLGTISPKRTFNPQCSESKNKQQIKNVRSPSEILAFIKSCDKPTKTHTPGVIQSACHPVGDCVNSLSQPSDNVHKKVLGTIGPKRKFKSQFSNSENEQKINMVATQSSNSSKNKKLVSFWFSYYLFY